MLKISRNIFATCQLTAIKQAFLNIKNNQYDYPQNFVFNNQLRITSKKIIEEENIKCLFTNYIEKELNKTYIFNELSLEESYLLWNQSENRIITNSYQDNGIISVISDKMIYLEFYTDNKKINKILKKSDLLMYSSNLPISFYNHKIANLAFFHCKYNKIFDQNEEQYCRMG